jgi:glycosyltransferase involved in cell wall biosynthesis
MFPELSIIIPAFDEEQRIGKTLEQILGFRSDSSRFGTIFQNCEIIIVDDGSSDKTAETAESIFSEKGDESCRVIRYKENKGKGFAVRLGLKEAKGDYAIFSDADLSTPIEEAAKLLEPLLNDECDLAFGSRALDRSLIGRHQPFRREQGGKVFNLVVRLSTGMPFWDTQCGFKAFKMSAIRPLLDLMKIDRFGFDVEMLYVAYLNGLRLREIPVRWFNDERSKVNVLRDSIRMFSEVLEIRRKAQKGEYNGKA